MSFKIVYNKTHFKECLQVYYIDSKNVVTINHIKNQNRQNSKDAAFSL
jgi:hypothetical protein